MKLTRKLSLWIGLAMCAVLAVHAWLRVRSDSEQYRADVLRDHDTTGRSLATAVELLWRSDGERRAREIVEELNLRTLHAQIRWVWLDADPSDHEAPSLPELALREGIATRSEVVDGADGVPHIVSYTPVAIPGERRGAIEIDESLAAERAHLSASLARTATATLLLLAVSIAIALGFGIVFVARPLKLLAAKAERIGAGELGGPVHIDQDDEIRDVARAMNAMCERLGEARTRLDAETAAKLRAVEQLRHADRLRTVGQLASTIAHEMGTPLNVVRARGAMIAGGELGPERSRELGGVIVEQCDRVADTIRRLLDFSRRDPPDRFHTDLARPVRQAVQWLEAAAREHGVRVELETAASELGARVDPRQIQQAVTNLVLNAVQASPRGERVVVRVSRDEAAREAVIEVSDHGPGIAPELRARVTEPFFTTKPAGQGTGLGLAIVEEIAREHGGRVELGEAPGGGARVRMVLSLEEVAPQTAQRSAARESWRRAASEAREAGAAER